MGATVALAPTVALPMALGAGLYYVFNSDAVVGSEAVKEALENPEELLMDNNVLKALEL